MTSNKWKSRVTARLFRMKIGFKIAVGRQRSVALVTNEKALHAVILNEIDKVIGANSISAEFKLNDLVDRIVQLVSNVTNPSPTLWDRMNIETKGLTRAGFFRFAQVCGIMGLWELNLRMFAARLDVDVRRPENERGKRSGHLVDYADLSDVISALNPKIKALNLELVGLNRLRNKFVHGNFQAAREMVTARLTKMERERYKGQVIAISLDDGRLTNLSEKLLKKDLEAQDQFAWFLEVFETELFDAIFESFQDSLLVIHDMILLRSLCFDRAQGAFDRLVADGVQLEGASLEGVLANARTIHVEDGHIRFVVEKLNARSQRNQT
jgi:hypothetical protein